MEIIGNNGPENSPKCGLSLCGRNVYIGVLLVVIGVVWLLHNFDIVGVRFFDVIFSWQMLCVVVGGYLLSCRIWFWGTVVASVGAIFLLGDLLGICLPVVKVLLPLLVIGLGIALVVRRNF